MPLNHLPSAAGLTPSLVVVVDDEIFICEAWEQLLESALCLFFLSPSDFMQWAEADPVRLATVSCFVFDLYLNAAINGMELAVQLRPLTTKPIILSTDAMIKAPKGGPVTMVMAKDPMDLASLEALLAASST